MTSDKNHIPKQPPKPLPLTAEQALNEIADLYFMQVEAGRAEYVVGLIEDAINQSNKETD